MQMRPSGLGCFKDRQVVALATWILSPPAFYDEPPGVRKLACTGDRRCSWRSPRGKRDEPVRLAGDRRGDQPCFAVLGTLVAVPGPAFERHREAAALVFTDERSCATEHRVSAFGRRSGAAIDPRLEGGLTALFFYAVGG